jgi:hypothetical protein
MSLTLNGFHKACSLFCEAVFEAMVWQGLARGLARLLVIVLHHTRTREFEATFKGDWQWHSLNEEGKKGAQWMRRALVSKRNWQKAHQAALIPRRSKRGAWLRKLPKGILLLWRGVEPTPFRLPKVQPELLPMPSVLAHWEEVVTV